MYGRNVKLIQMANQAISGTGASLTGIDLANNEDPVVLMISARSGGTNTMSITIEHSASLGSGYTAVPASAIYDMDTGAASAFADVSTTTYAQYRGLVRQQLNRYLRVTFAGATLTHNVAVVAAVQRKYTENA